MYILANEIISSFDNNKSCSELKHHNVVKAYDINNLEFSMSSLFIVSPKDGIVIKEVTETVTKLHQQPFQDIFRIKAYKLELQMIKMRETTSDVLDIATGMDTVNSVMLFLKSKNYANEFFVKGDGWILLKNEIYQQNEIKLVKIYRFEGDSNPSDEAIIYLIKADSGPFGYSLDGYGISSNHDHDQYVEFIRMLSFRKLV